MELDSLIPYNSDHWSINSTQLLFKRCGINIPICTIDDNIVYIFIDNKALDKVILKIVKHLLKIKVEFYFYPPTYSHPATVLNSNNVIFHYFITYANPKYYDGFQKIGFDFIENMTKWCHKENCFNLIKPNYLLVQKKVQDSWFDHYSRKKVFEYPEHIRDDFNSLYRHILVSEVI